VIVCFVDIGEIDDHHCLEFLCIIVLGYRLFYLIYMPFIYMYNDLQILSI